MIILIIIIGDFLKSILSNIRKNYKCDFIRLDRRVRPLKRTLKNGVKSYKNNKYILYCICYLGFFILLFVALLLFLKV